MHGEEERAGTGMSGFGGREVKPGQSPQRVKGILWVAHVNDDVLGVVSLDVVL